MPEVGGDGLKGQAQVVGVGGGDDAGVGRESRVSSVGGGAMASLGKAPKKD